METLTGFGMVFSVMNDVDSESETVLDIDSLNAALTFGLPFLSVGFHPAFLLTT